MLNSLDFTINFGGLNILIACENANFAQRLQIYYQRFLGKSDGENASLSLTLIDQPIYELWDEPELFWTASGLNVAEAAYFGSIGSSTFKAELQLSRFYPIQKVDHFLRIATALWTFQTGGILFHAAALERNGTGYIFTGHSGKGKTTVCRVSQPAKVLNDDLIIVSPSAPGWRVWATPFTNPSQVPPNPGQANLKKIFQLNQAKQNAILMEEPATALADLITHIPVIPKSAERLNELMGRCRKLIDEIKIYNLYFLPDNSFWQLIDSA